MNKEETLSITKMDAAKRQLHTAIRLWFAEDDPVSIHTLLSAAHELIHTMFRSAGLAGLFFDSRSIPDEIRTEVSRAIKRPSEFFKHARSDVDKTLEFTPALNGILMLYCVNGLWRLKEYPSLEEVSIWTWLNIHHPGWFGIQKDALPPNMHAVLAHLPKQKFLKQITEAWGSDAAFRRAFAEELLARGS